MIVRRIVLWSVSVLLVLFLAAASWLWIADLGVLKPYIERALSDASGRSFSIDGRLSIDLSGRTTIVAEDVRLQNADWADRDTMLEVGYFEVHLDLWPLFRDRIEIGYVGIRDVRLHLVRDEQKGANWEFSTEGAEADGDGDFGKRIKLGRVDVERLALTVDGPERDVPLEIRIDKFRKDDREDDFVRTQLAGTIGDRLVSFDAIAGPATGLREGRDVEFEVTGRLDTLAYNASGTIDDLANPLRPSLEFAARGPDVDDLGRLFDVGDLGEGDIDLRGTLGPGADDLLVLDVAGNFGGLDIEGNGTFSDLDDPRQAALKVLVSGPNLGRILRLAGIRDVADSPFMLVVDAQRDGQRLTIRESRMVFGNAMLALTAELPRFPALDDGRINLDVEGPDIAYFRSVVGLPGVATGEFAARLDYTGVPDGDDELALDVITSLGRLEANGTVGAAPRYLGSRLDVRLTANDLAAAGSIAGLDRLPSVPALASGTVELVDAGLRTLGPLEFAANDLTATLDGHLALPDPAGSRMKVGIAGPDLASTVGTFTDADMIPALPYAVTGQMEMASTGLLLEGMEGRIGSSAIAVDGLVSFRPGLEGSRFTIEAAGPAMEELSAPIAGIDLKPGPYELGGIVAISGDELELTGFELDRENGDARLDMMLGLLPDERRATFDLSTRGRDVRSVVAGVGGLDLAELPFEVEVKGRLLADRLSVDAFKARVGELQTQARGSVLLGAKKDSATFRISGEVPDVATLGTVNDVPLSPQRIVWQASVTSGGGVVEADEISLIFGDSDLRGRLRFEAGPVPSVEIDIDSDTLILGRFLVQQEHAYDPEPPFDDGRLIPDIRISFDRLATVNAAVDVDIGHLEYGQLDLTDLMLRAGLQDGVFELQRAGARGPTGRFDIRGRIDPDGGEGRVSVEVLARDLTLRERDDDTELRLNSDIGLRLSSTGDDLRTLAARANGHVYSHSRGDWLFRSRLLQAIYGDMLGEILNAINPFYRKSAENRLECIVIPLRLTAGRVKSPSQVFVRTDKINIVAQPEMELDSEALDIVFRTTPRKGLTISAAELLNPYVKVVGTLAAPRLVVDEQGVLVSGAAAVASGGLTILARAAWSRLSRSADPCGKAASDAIEALGEETFPVFEKVNPDAGQR